MPDLVSGPQAQQGGRCFVGDDRGRWELGGVAVGWIAAGCVAAVGWIAAAGWLQGRRLQAASSGRGRDERLQCCIVDSGRVRHIWAGPYPKLCCWVRHNWAGLPLNKKNLSGLGLSDRWQSMNKASPRFAL
jgi:hypothetical protein